MSWLSRLLGVEGKGRGGEGKRDAKPSSPTKRPATVPPLGTSTQVDFPCECGADRIFDLREFDRPGGQNGLHVMCSRCGAIVLVPPTVLDRTMKPSASGAPYLVPNWRAQVTLVTAGRKGLQSKRFGTFQFRTVSVLPFLKELIYDTRTDLPPYRAVKLSINITIRGGSEGSPESHDEFHRILALAESKIGRLLSLEPTLKQSMIPTAKDAIKKHAGAAWTGNESELLKSLVLQNVLFCADGTISLRYGANEPCEYRVGVLLDDEMKIKEFETDC